VGEIMTKKLKQCPFCGGEGKIIDKKDFRETAHQVQCQKCYSITDLYSYREDAITAWNTRTPDVNKDLLEALKEATRSDFQLSAEQRTKLNDWNLKHYDRSKHYVCEDGRLTYSFTPKQNGTDIEIKCDCGHKIFFKKTGGRQ